MNDFRKIELFDVNFTKLVKSHLDENEQKQFFNAVKFLPYEFIYETLYKYLKFKCIQINI